jgi:hypothetical protein
MAIADQQASLTNLAVCGAIRYPTSVGVSRALVVRTQTLVCAQWPAAGSVDSHAIFATAYSTIAHQGDGAGGNQLTPDVQRGKREGAVRLRRQLGE